MQLLVMGIGLFKSLLVVVHTPSLLLPLQEKGIRVVVSGRASEGVIHDNKRELQSLLGNRHLGFYR
jgi:predicted MPP superfamily phosphohydrolase